MKVLFVSENFSNGGLETNIYTTIQSMKNNVEFFFAFGRYNEDWNLKNVYKGFHFKLNSTIENFIEDVENLIKIINNNKIDIVHVEPFFSFFPAVFAAKICKIPVVYTYHGLGSFNFPCYPNDVFLFNILMDYEVDKVFSVSREGQKIMQSIIMEKEKVVFLPNSIDTNKFVKCKVANNRQWALVSRLDKDKINEIKKIIQAVKYVDIDSLHIFGDGTEKGTLENFIEEENLTEKVIIRGYCNNLPEKINGKFNGVIGIGRALMEAISMEMPTILIGFNKIAGVLDYKLYKMVKNENFVNKYLEDISLDELKYQIQEVYNNFYDKRIFRLFKKEFSADIISNKYYKEIKKIKNVTLLDLESIVEDLKKLDKDKYIYSSDEVFEILRNHLAFYVRQPNQKNIIMLKNV